MIKIKTAIILAIFSLLLLSFLSPPTSASIDHIIISEFYPDTYTHRDADEYISIYNPTDDAIDISNWTISDKEATIAFPKGSKIKGKQKLYITKNAMQFKDQSKKIPDFEYGKSDLNVTQMIGGKIQLRNGGDELLLSDRDGKLIDAVIYGDSDYTGDGWHGPSIGKTYEGVIFKRDELYDSDIIYYISDTDSKKDWDDLRIHYLGQSDFLFNSFNFSGTAHVFTSPDSSFDEVTRVIDSAEESLYICSYEFNNTEIAKHLIFAQKRGVDVRVLLEGGPVDKISEESHFIASEIARAGGKVYFMIGNKTVHDRYKYIHSKYILADNKTTLITTENFKYTGIPKDNSFGNRGWGIVIENADVTSYFVDVFEDDFSGDDLSEPKSFDGHIKEVEIPTGDYEAIFSSKTISGDFTIIPVIAPDTALINETVLGLINSAEKSIYIEQNYVHTKWGNDPNLYLEAVIDAARRGCEVKILLDNSWYNTDLNSECLFYLNSLAEDENLDMEVRLVRDDLHIDKLHTKGVIVDSNKTFISSINWNKNSPTQNREVGVIVVNPDVASYFSDVFMYDWKSVNNSDESTSVIFALVISILTVGAGLFVIRRYLQ